LNVHREAAINEISTQSSQSLEHERIDFKAMILETLSELGGRGKVQDILIRIENKLKDRGQLTAYWLEKDPKQTRWKHAVHGTRMQLIPIPV
jgi:hypothetical protein